MEPRAIERDLDELETRIERLRALYEQYFMGIERLEPQIPRKELERRISLLRKEHIRNTALRFKFQMLIQRYNTLQQYWARVTREIESGTYRRDVMRVALRFGEKEALTILGKKRARQYAALAEAQAELKKRQAAADLEEEEVELDAEDFIDDETASAPPARGSSPSIASAPSIAKPPPPPLPARGSSPSIALAAPIAKPPPPPPPARGSSPSIAPAAPIAKPPPPPPPDESLGEPRIRQIYAKYVETKRQANESTAGVTYEKLAATLRAQTQRLRESHPTKTVDYEVVVKDGKTQLKPILR